MTPLEGLDRLIPDIGWWQLFEDQAKTSPSRIALVFDGQTLTFAELDTQANQLARMMRAKGVSSGAIVACVMSRSLQAVAVLLAVAKSGGVYLPLDLALPEERMGMILEEAQPALLLTDQNTVGKIATRQGISAEIFSDDTLKDLSTYSPEAIESDVAPATCAAYIIYTSGSSGGPKGVIVGNRSLVNLYRELEANVFPLAHTLDDEVFRVAHGIPFAFDASWNPVMWMVGGHELHLLSDEDRTDPARYVNAIRTRQLHVVEAVPTMVAAMTGAGLLASGTCPRLLLMGGEAVGQALWSQLRETDGLSTANLYGPTEASVFVTAGYASETPTIGRPIANVRVRLVDEQLQPVETGKSGELLLAGACLAHGYLNQPDLTANRFITLEDAHGPERWYRTGDICRRLPDGNLEFLRRLDDQVKIRGYRIEPGEAEHVLRAHSSVKQAVVLAEGKGAERRLVAYVVPTIDAGGAVLEGKLRTQLQAALPRYSVPSKIIMLNTMPTNRNGKIDRYSLASVGAQGIGSGTPTKDVKSPATATEQAIAESWSAALGVEIIDVHADFFELGGHSLLAAQISAHLRSMGISCTLTDVLRNPTIAALASIASEVAIKEKEVTAIARDQTQF
ncbi:non-ribosomal peptide synthetase [Streptomyces chartreusis]|uniref:non-ribosomal peptide synthetase n=1 Tax=Streptomyces chartreusis TaxID=1969 RepID=UPI0037FB5CE0